ncbi:hypothetical protein L198_02903 [Cryptococcus wingfieldii CBS 7118]|uniref:Uncharacterized protein n=1 Tax=Cryptococcus wingfieldii CBS 7118 TaxID=1295528 RepID=A0A1E3JID8_9TREE|nr:hypothetical protein L198_02903 [Cryptococcus wingfieldii CBS 7118]ODO00583.1 hypothetical protein L198_02903 [Cryptococcus wingfieldii CBS 7118]
MSMASYSTTTPSQEAQLGGAITQSRLSSEAWIEKSTPTSDDHGYYRTAGGLDCMLQEQENSTTGFYQQAVQSVGPCRSRVLSAATFLPVRGIVERATVTALAPCDVYAEEDKEEMEKANKINTDVRHALQSSAPVWLAECRTRQSAEPLKEAEARIFEEFSKKEEYHGVALEHLDPTSANFSGYWHPLSELLDRSEVAPEDMTQKEWHQLMLMRTPLSKKSETAGNKDDTNTSLYDAEDAQDGDNGFWVGERPTTARSWEDQEADPLRAQPIGSLYRGTDASLEMSTVPLTALFHETFTTVSKEDDAERKTEAVQRANGMMSDINEILQETEHEWYPQVLQSRDLGAFNTQEQQAYERLSGLEQYEGVGFVKVPLDTARAVSRIKPDHIGDEEWEIYLREWDAARGSSRQQEEGGETTLSRRSRFSRKLRTFFRSHA